MSYGFTMHFIHCRGMSDAFLCANVASELFYQDFSEYLEKNKYWIPGLRFASPSKTDCEKRADDDLWLEQVMRMNFVWWPEYKLLALAGSGYSKSVTDLFKSSVYFQNSCDQDYPFDTWKGLRRPFDDIVKVCQDGSAEKVAKYMQMGRNFPMEYAPDTEDGIRFDDHYRRWAAYNGVFETLRLGKWLHGQSDDAFVRFALTPLNSSERVFDAQMMLRSFVERHEKDLW